MDSVIIGFTEKINAVYETSVTAGCENRCIQCQHNWKIQHGIELGAIQSSTKTIEKITIVGFFINFEISSKKGIIYHD